MYRGVGRTGEVRERRAQRRHPSYTAPEFARDRAKLALELGHHETQRPDNLVLVSSLRHLDVFSRYVVSWMIAPPRESGVLAERLITANL